MAADDESGSGGPAPTSGKGGSILTRKTGPLANWIWMAILLLVALVYSLWKRNKASADTNTDGPTVDDTLGNQTPPPVFILPQNPQPSVPITINVPGSGTGATPSPAPPGAVKPVPSAPPKIPAPPPKSTAAAYWVVTVDKYTSKNPVWNSTLWGIANHSGYGAKSDNWAAIWNDPKNAALKKKRGTPAKIQPGDKIYVLKK